MQPRFPSIGDWISKLYYTQTLLEEVAMARVNIDILGIRELKWTGMGEFSLMTIISTTVGKNSLEEME